MLESLSGTGLSGALRRWGRGVNGGFQDSISQGTRRNTSCCVAHGTATRADADTLLRSLAATSSACPRQCPIRDTARGGRGGAADFTPPGGSTGGRGVSALGPPRCRHVHRAQVVFLHECLRPSRLPNLFAPKRCVLKTNEEQLWVVSGGLGVDRDWGAGKGFGVSRG